MFTQENIGGAHVPKQLLYAPNVTKLDHNLVRVPTFIQALLRNEKDTKLNGVQKPKFWDVHTCAPPTCTKRFAFYQAGKCLVQTLLFHHPEISLLRLTNSRNNAVSSIPRLPLIETPTNLETVLVGLYAGQAGEFFTGLSKVETDKRFFSSKGKATALCAQTCYKDAALRLTKRKKQQNSRYTKTHALLRAHNRAPVRRFAVTRTRLCKLWSKDGLDTPTYKANAKTKLYVPERSSGTYGVQNKVIPKRSYAGASSGYQNFVLVSKTTLCKNYVVPKRSFGNATQRTYLPCMPSFLLHEQHDTVLPSFDHFALATQLNRAKIEQLLCQSDTGLVERIQATFLAQSIAINGSICSQNIFNLQKNSVVGNLNKTEIKDKKTFSLFQGLEEQTQSVYFQGTQSDALPNKQNLSVGNTSSFYTNSYKGSVTKPKVVTEPLGSQALQSSNLLSSNKLNCISQKKEISAWCEEVVKESLASSTKSYGHWFRIYLPQIETHQRQPVSLDNFFKKRRELGSFKNEKQSYAKTKLCKNYVFATQLLCMRTKLRFVCKQIHPVKNLKDLVVPNRANVSVAGVPLSCAPSKISFLLVAQKANYTTMGFAQKRSLHVQKATKLDKLRKHSFLNTYSALVPHLVYQDLVFEKTLSKKERSTKTKVFEGRHARNSNKMLTKNPPPAWPEELDYGMSHNLVLNTFSGAFNVIEKNRELLDMVADHLIRFGKIRSPEISRICSLYVDTTDVFAGSVD